METAIMVQTTNIAHDAGLAIIGPAAVQVVQPGMADHGGQEKVKAMTEKEVKALPVGAKVWLEGRAHSNVIPCIVNLVFNSQENIVFFETLSGEWKVQAHLGTYGYAWRCWPFTPTAGQRVLTPWKG